MKIPAEFEDIFRGVELTEREALFLSWITSWDDYTIQNMRTVLEKVRSTLSKLQAENETLRAELKSKVDLVFQQAKELDRRHLLLQEQEAELEQVKREQCRIPKGYALVKLELLEELDNFRDLGPIDRLRELAQADKGGKIKAYIVDGFYCDICQKRHDRIKEIKVYLTRDAAEAALSERR